MSEETFEFELASPLPLSAPLTITPLNLFIQREILTLSYGVTCGEMVSVVGNLPGDSSSNPG